MDKVKAMQTFVRIVEARSFTRAAESLGLPRAALTATIQKLEAYLGAQLLQRTTRKLALTQDGAGYYRQCVAILQAIEAAELPFRGPGRPQGRLRVELPSAVGRILVMPRIAQFHARYPDVELVLGISDRLADITQEGIDCALRIGHLQDSALVGRQIGVMRFVTCGAPAYLAQYGVPATLDDLQRHRCVVHFSNRTGRAFDWDFTVDGKVVTVPMRGPVAVSDADAYVCAALQGLGLVQAAAYQVRAHIAGGALVPLFEQWPPTSMPVSLLYPQGRLASPKAAAFAGWLADLFAADPELRL
jgi:LysR family transcriptional regulator for bpeEF and oprC